MARAEGSGGGAEPSLAPSFERQLTLPTAS